VAAARVADGMDSVVTRLPVRDVPYIRGGLSFGGFECILDGGQAMAQAQALTQKRRVRYRRVTGRDRRLNSTSQQLIRIYTSQTGTSEADDIGFVVLRSYRGQQLSDALCSVAVGSSIRENVSMSKWGGAQQEQQLSRVVSGNLIGGHDVYTSEIAGDIILSMRRCWVDG
jgi:hypothetical protein